MSGFTSLGKKSGGGGGGAAIISLSWFEDQ